MFRVRGIWSGIRGKWAVLFALLAGLLVPVANAQTWSWQTERVDRSGKFTALAADTDGNLHLSYSDGEGKIKYAFRTKSAGKWFSMALDGGDGFTDLTIDQQGNPHVCFVFRVVKYASFDGKQWHVQSIATDAARISFSCAVGVGPDGTPHVSWYRDQNVDNSYYTHLKYAVLVDDTWVIRTVDFDTQTGKWHSMIVDSRGVPHLSYDAFVNGNLKYAFWDGKHWVIKTVDFRGRSGPVHNIGMGNSLALDAKGQARISYQDGESLKFARQQGDTWTIETVDNVTALGSWVGWRTSLVLDRRGFPHISYDDGGTLKHAYWDGTKWRIQVIAPRASDPYRYSAMTIDKDDTLYISYRDPQDSSLQVAIGRWTEQPQTAGAGNKEKN